ncbi:MAG: hypothetical protein ACI9XO_000210 [Paraglaciecola sp.]|jgi:hypothetical protein
MFMDVVVRNEIWHEDKLRYLFKNIICNNFAIFEKIDRKV